MTAFNPSGGPFGQPAGDFTPVVYTDADLQLSTLKPISQLELYWRRFRTHRLGLIGLGTMGFFILLALLASVIVPNDPATPYFALYNLPFGAGTAPTLAHFPYLLFGTTSSDDLQKSVLAEVLYGARVSLYVGFVGASLVAIIGTVVGAISGYFGGWIDNLVMRITDIFLALPFLPLVIAISAFYRANDNPNIILLILVFTSWPGLARLVRGLYLSLREQEYTEAAKAVGVNQWRIIFRHLLPNALSPVVVATTLNVAGFVTIEATLDFLGLGVTFPPTPTWGNTLTSAQGALTIGNWWWPAFPGLILVLTVLAVNFLGDGLRDALDVRSRVE